MISQLLIVQTVVPHWARWVYAAATSKCRDQESNRGSVVLDYTYTSSGQPVHYSSFWLTNDNTTHCLYRFSFYNCYFVFYDFNCELSVAYTWIHVFVVHAAHEQTPFYRRWRNWWSSIFDMVMGGRAKSLVDWDWSPVTLVRFSRRKDAVSTARKAPFAHRRVNLAEQLYVVV